MNRLPLGYEEALRLTLAGVEPLAVESAPLIACVGRVAGAELRARVDSPGAATSRKDGYALRGAEVAQAGEAAPVRLKLAGIVAAGDREEVTVSPGTAVRVLTGARIPPGADAVVSEEFTRVDGGEVLVLASAPAKNILPVGGDVARGEVILETGEVITPVAAGLLAAGGLDQAAVFVRPQVGILGTGSEIVMPGGPLKPGQVHASNLVTLAGFCGREGMATSLGIVGDEAESLRRAISALLNTSDALITSGGAWRGERDLVAQALDDLGWRKVFHRIRMGPGKAVGFGLLAGKPVFLLPGGPPSNLMGFLQIALPGLHLLAGRARPGLPRMAARLAADIPDGNTAWTDFFQGSLSPSEDGLPLFHPLPKRSRLSALATANAVAAIPEGRERLAQGEIIRVQLLGAGLVA